MTTSAFSINQGIGNRPSLTKSLGFIALQPREFVNGDGESHVLHFLSHPDGWQLSTTHWESRIISPLLPLPHKPAGASQADAQADTQASEHSSTIPIAPAFAPVFPQSLSEMSSSFLAHHSNSSPIFTNGLQSNLLQALPSSHFQPLAISHGLSSTPCFPTTQAGSSHSLSVP